MCNYKFWFVVGSQFLYGPGVLDTVAARATEMAAEMSKQEENLQVAIQVAWRVDQCKDQQDTLQDQQEPFWVAAQDLVWEH